MQENSKKLYKTIGKILHNERIKSGIKYTDFCYENDISMSTYDNIINGSKQITFFNIAKVVKALNLSFEEFGRYLDKELPENFLNQD